MSSESNQSRSASKRHSIFDNTRFVIQHRLPQQVFVRTTPNDFLFFEYARAFSSNAWHLFVHLVHAFGEPHIWFTTFDPDAYEYYLEHFGMSAETRFATEAPAAEYIRQMHQWPASSIADAPAYQADVVAWTGETGHWRCWGERASGLCILQLQGNEQLRNELILWDDNDFPILTLEEALRDVVANEFSDVAAFKQFSEQFRKHYASSSM